MRTLAPPLVAALVRALGLSLRMTLSGVTPLVPLWQSKHPLIYALWHGRSLMMPWLNAQLRATHGARVPRWLVNLSRNGEPMGRFVRRFGIDVVMRGPSSQASAAALRALAAAVDEGQDVVVIADGPRGPHETFKPGAIALAALTGAPIVPVSLAAYPAGRLPSWDRFLIPLPFARCVAVFGVPVAVPRDADRAQACREMERTLSAITATADRLARS